MGSPYIRTIEDMEALYYKKSGMAILGSDDTVANIAKIDAPVLTGTTGVYNPIYGAYAWAQLNLEANAFGVLPKNVWHRSGWRVITTRSAGTGADGRAEAAALPDSVKPVFAQVSTLPKTHADVFEVSEVQEYLAQSGNDDAYGDMASMRRYMAMEHAESINIALLADAGTVAGYNIESLDRIVSNYASLAGDKDGTGAAYDAGDLDPYGPSSTSFNRDGGATYLDSVTVYNGGTLRPLTDDLVREVMYKTAQNGAKSMMWFTGHDTSNDIAGLYQSQVRYMGETMIKPSVNGIQTLDGKEGISGGLRVATLYQYPVIVSKNTLLDTASGKSRLFLLDSSNPEGFDLPRLSIKIAKPTQYFEAGINAGTPFAVNKFTDKGLYRTMGELICTFFKAQGKITNLA
jgi:hypothetical protein